MSTKIEWCMRPGTKPEVWNPITGCNKVSRGCKNCYAEVMHSRLQGMFPKKYSHNFLDGAHEHSDMVMLPLKWKTPRTVFVNSMSDLFHENVSFLFIDAVFRVMADVCQHTYIVLTKRDERMLQFFEWKKEKFGIEWQPSGNVWLGVSDEGNQHQRIDTLRKIPAAVKIVSFEPLVFNPGAVDLTGINGVYVGGESGYKAVPMHPDWPHAIMEACRKYGASFFFKQWGEFKPWEEQDCPIEKSVCVHPKSDNSNLLARMIKTGKKHSGRSLDGIEYNEQPA